MILLWALPPGLIIGWLTGGRLRNIESRHLRKGYLVALGLGIQLLIFPLGRVGPVITWGTEGLHIVSYGLLALFLWANRKYWPFVLMAVGLLANLLVIAVNGGLMPADPEALSRAGAHRAAEILEEKGRVGNVVRMGASTRLNFLGDWLYIPEQVPLATAFSLGDLVIALGLLLFFPYAMQGVRS
ncbi:MAG: DUF5317 domain-containing protein [Candidatus Bipolaricaulota bacterium]